MMSLSTNQIKESIIKNLSSRDWWKSWALVVGGCSILAAAFVLFINPYNIVPGGVYGASIVLHSLFPSIKVGTFGYMFDIPLLIISVLFLGGKLGVRTTFAAMLTPALMNILTELVYPAEAITTLDPAFLCSGLLDLSDHIMLSTIIGSVGVGIGSGLIVRGKATSGGTDIIAMIIQKFVGLKFSVAILLCDGIVVSSSLVVMSLGFSVNGTPQQGMTLALYSLLAIYIVSRTIALTINGRQQDKVLFVISDKSPEDFRKFILHELDRTATCIKASGLYSNEDKDMLFLVVSEKESNTVKHKIREYDPNAFVVISSASATYGEGFKALPMEGELIPE